MKNKILFKTTLIIIGSLFYLWCIPALYFSIIPWSWLRVLFASIFAIVVPTFMVIFKCNKKSLIGAYTSFLLIIILFNCKSPSNDRDWDTSVAVLPKIDFKGHLVDVHNIRNFKYKTADDFTVGYYDRVFDVNKLTSLYLALSYWDGHKSIAHAIFSFGFSDDHYLAVSSEIRLSKGEKKSLLGGIFNEYEITYILADEEDVLKLRTNYRKEEVYLYNVKPKGGIEDIRKFFIYLMKKVDALEEKPKFYNTITTNCLTSLLHDFAVSTQRNMAFDIRLIKNGYFDELMYERGVLETEGLSFPELKKQRHINQYVEKDAHNYSKKIRTALHNTNTHNK